MSLPENYEADHYGPVPEMPTEPTVLEKAFIAAHRILDRVVDQLRGLEDEVSTRKPR